MQEFSPAPPDRLVDSDRLDRVRAALKESDHDGLLAFSPANSYYLSGCYAGMYSRPVVGLVTEDGSAFVGPRLEAPKARRTAWTDSAVAYEDTDDPFDVIADVVRDADATRLGVDRSHARPDWVTSVDSRVDASLIDASETFLELRMVKTEWELDMIRRSRDLATAGIEAFVEATTADRPELEVVDAMQDAYYDTYLSEYADYDIGTANELGQYGFASALTGEHALEPHSISSARSIQNGETVVGIALPSVQGYVCEEERTVLVGDVSEDVREAMETLVDVRERVIELVGPGEATDEIDARAVEWLSDAGYGSNLMHRTGHGEGITIHEGPALNERESGELRPGMVISIEPGLYFTDEGVALRHSDTLIVTETGAERLTTSDAGVIRVD